MHKLLIICLMLVVFLSLSYYTYQSRQYPQWDEHHYVTIAVKTYDAIQEKGLLGIVDSIAISGSRQPVYPLLITVLLFITGTTHTYQLALIVNAVLFSLTILGTYIIARAFLSNTSSVVAAFLSATYGNALFYAHFTYVETAVTTMIVWSIVFLLKTHQFSNRRWTIGAGLFVAFSTLTRFVAPVFLAGPILVVSIQSVLRSFPHRKTLLVKLLNLCVFFLLAIALPVFLYFIPNRDPFFEYVRNNQSQGAQWVTQYRDPALANTFSVRSIMFYFNIIQQNTIVPFLLFAFGCISIFVDLFRLFLRKAKFEAFIPGLFLFGMFLLPYAFLTFVTIWKEDRFLVSIYPAMALISAYCIEKILRFRRTRVLVLTSVTAVMCLSFVGALFGIGPMGQRGLVDYVTPRWIPHPRRLYLTPLVWPPRKEYANAHLFIEAIENDWKNTHKASIGLGFNHEPFINAVTSILSYEKRDFAVLQINPSASDSAQLDYLATSPEMEETTQWKKLTNITIPYDNSVIYVYKRMQ